MTISFRRLTSDDAWRATRVIGLLMMALSLPRSAVCQEPAPQELEPPTEQLPPTLQPPPPPPPDALVAPPDNLPSPAIAGPPVKATLVPQHLDLGLSLFEAYNLTTVNDGLPGLTTDPRLTQNTSFTGADVSLTYVQVGEKRAFSAVAGSDFRYYSIAPTVLPLNYFGGLNFSTALGRHVTIHGSESVSYSPYYSFGGSSAPNLATTQIVLPQTDENIAFLKTYTSDSSASLSWTINRKASFSTGYTLNYVDTPDALYRVTNQSANAGFAYQITKYMTMRLGYGYSQSSLDSFFVPSFNSQDINVGLGYRRPLSFSRHTIVGFNLGSTLLSSAGQHDFYLTGDASLTQQLNRTWTASLSYSRAVSSVGVLAAPFVTDNVGGGIAGQWTRHIGFSVNGGYTHGSAVLGVQNAYLSANGSSRLTGQFTRFLPVYVEYVYYYYRFDQSVGLVPGFPLLVNRSGIRTGLSYSIPLIGQRAYRP